MGIDLSKAEIGAWWFDGTGVLREQLREHLSAHIDQRASSRAWVSDPSITVIDIPVLGSLHIRHWPDKTNTFEILCYTGARFNASEFPRAIETLKQLSRVGVRWTEHRFITDTPTAYRLRGWAAGELPTIEEIYYSPEKRK